MSVAGEERVPLKSTRHSMHATLKHARTAKGTVAAQERSLLEKSTEGRIATPTHNSVNSLRSPLHDGTNSILNGEKLAITSAIAAQGVFETAELLEIILLQLGAKDILTAQQVGRQWRDAVNGSMRLKRRLGIELDDLVAVPYFSPLAPGSDYSSVSPSLVYTDNRAQVRPYPGDSVMGVKTNLQKTLEVYFRVCRPGGHTLRAGSRCRTVRLCHPPLKRARIAYFRHGCLLQDGGYKSSTLDKPSGINLGDLLDAAEGKCLEAKSLEPAIEDVQLLLYGCVELSEHDPIVEEREASFVREEARNGGKSMSPATGF